jgi:integrase
MLTDKQVRALKPRERPYKAADAGGLYLYVSPAGGKHWRLKYRFASKERLLTLGSYPAVSLSAAREKKDAAREQVAKGINPAAIKAAERVTQAVTFRAVAAEWIGKQTWATKTREKAEWTFRDLIYPDLGDRPIAEIDAPMILDCLRKIEARGKHETAHRTRQRISQVMQYAIATGKAKSDPTPRGRSLAPIKVSNRAAITDPRQVGGLLRALADYAGEVTTAAALRLAPLVFVRPGELRNARWSEFHLDEGHDLGPLWRIPKERMKMSREHLVPLSRQAVAILRDLHALTGNGKLLFPGLRSRDRPISDNTLNAALRRLGYGSDEMTAHGFRAMASTLLNEQGFPPDIIELQLAHQEKNKVRAAYNRSQRFAERRKMMQAWADYLDRLKVGKA